MREQAKGAGWFNWRRREATAALAATAPPPLTFRAVERTLALFVAGLTDGALVAAESPEAA